MVWYYDSFDKWRRPREGKLIEEVRTINLGSNRSESVFTIEFTTEDYPHDNVEYLRAFSRQLYKTEEETLNDYLDSVKSSLCHFQEEFKRVTSRLNSIKIGIK